MQLEGGYALQSFQSLLKILFLISRFFKPHDQIRFVKLLQCYIGHTVTDELQGQTSPSSSYC